MTSGRTEKMAPRTWGLTPEELATRETVFGGDLFREQKVLITGGGSGMGRATAFLMARLGAQVMIAGRDADKLGRATADIQRLLGLKVHSHPVNIRDPQSVAELVDASMDVMGGVDYLVNSAGGQFPQNAIDFSAKGWNAVVDTNLNGTWWMMQTMARAWVERVAPGHIVNIVANIDRGIPQSAHTAAARAGVVYLSKSVAVEWAPLNLRVNCIAPGTIETEGFNNYPPGFTERLGKANPMRRLGDVWDIAQGVAYLCAPSGKFITGEYMHINGGMHLFGTNWPLGIPDYFKDLQ